MSTIEEKQKIIKRAVNAALESTAPFHRVWLATLSENGEYKRIGLKSKAMSVVYYDRILNSAMKVCDVQLNSNS